MLAINKFQVTFRGVGLIERDRICGPRACDVLLQGLQNSERVLRFELLHDSNRRREIVETVGAHCACHC